MTVRLRAGSFGCGTSDWSALPRVKAVSGSPPARAGATDDPPLAGSTGHDHRVAEHRHLHVLTGEHRGPPLEHPPPLRGRFGGVRDSGRWSTVDSAGHHSTTPSTTARAATAVAGERDLAAEQRVASAVRKASTVDWSGERPAEARTRCSTCDQKSLWSNAKPTPVGFSPQPCALRPVDRLRAGLQVEDRGVGRHGVVVQPVRDLRATAGARPAPPPEQPADQAVRGPAQLVGRRPHLLRARASGSGRRSSRCGAVPTRAGTSTDICRRARTSRGAASVRNR